MVLDICREGQGYQVLKTDVDRCIGTLVNDIEEDQREKTAASRYAWDGPPPEEFYSVCIYGYPYQDLKLHCHELSKTVNCTTFDYNFNHDHSTDSSVSEDNVETSMEPND
jgi:hypothetical protein